MGPSSPASPGSKGLGPVYFWGSLTNLCFTNSPKGEGQVCCPPGSEIETGDNDAPLLPLFPQLLPLSMVTDPHPTALLPQPQPCGVLDLPMPREGCILGAQAGVLSAFCPLPAPLSSLVRSRARARALGLV